MRRWLALAIVVASPARADLEPGNWEISSQTEVTGSGQPVQLTQKRCLTAEDARDPSRVFGSAGAGCQFTRRADTGSLFTFEVSCGGQPELRGSGSVRYARESLEGELELASGQFRTRSRLFGRRLGGC